MINAADNIINLGPGSGENGGNLLSSNYKKKEFGFISF